MSVEYYYVNDLNRLYNAAVGDKTDGDEHHVRMMEAHDNLDSYMQKLEHWKDTALQLSRNNGEAQAKIQALEAEYAISNRELLIKQVEINRQSARIAELEAHIAALEEAAEIEELGAQEAERKEFCPNCEAETPCTHEAELFVCDICGEDFAKYIVSRNCNVSDVSTTQDILIPIKTSQSNENTNPDYYKHDAVSWISIANGRLPEKFQECIVLDKNKRVHNWMHDDALLPLFAQYTHWMPLPQLPEVQE